MTRTAEQIIEELLHSKMQLQDWRAQQRSLDLQSVALRDQLEDGYSIVDRLRAELDALSDPEREAAE